MITIFPHLDYKGFSWEYMAGKPSSDFAEAHRVVSMELLVDRSGGDAIGAETVEDWGLEAAHARHLWVYVERVEIAVKSVQKCEVFLRLFGCCVVWSPLWRSWDGTLDCTLSSESTNASDK